MLALFGVFDWSGFYRTRAWVRDVDTSTNPAANRCADHASLPTADDTMSPAISGSPTGKCTGLSRPRTTP